MKSTKTSAVKKRKSGDPTSRSQAAPTRRIARKSGVKPRTVSSKRSNKTRRAASGRETPDGPSILLEGDRPAATPVGGLAEKFALGPTPPSQQFGADTTELPSSYGTKRLFLTARDPHWLYAQWDLTPTQQSNYNKLSVDKHLVLRVRAERTEGAVVSEIRVHPESRHWFAHVGRAGTKYLAELGYYLKHRGKRVWTRIATSNATSTPADKVSPDTSVEFATIPSEVPFKELAGIVGSTAQTNLPLARALEALREGGHPQLPPVAGMSTSTWTEEQERALAEAIYTAHVRSGWIGSLETAELTRRQLEDEISSIGVTQFGVPTSPWGAVTSVSSPFGGPPGQKGFWFNINADIIIYGATEADATVTIGGRKITLRPDGSFSYRFTLPDGRYEMAVVAVSADGTDGRAADLRFTRTTELLGDVGAHPHDPSLPHPTREDV